VLLEAIQPVSDAILLLPVGLLESAGRELLRVARVRDLMPERRVRLVGTQVGRHVDVMDAHVALPRVDLPLERVEADGAAEADAEQVALIREAAEVVVDDDRHLDAELADALARVRRQAPGAHCRLAIFSEAFITTWAFWIRMLAFIGVSRTGPEVSITGTPSGRVGP
jgi:hypothetical protein